jgi:hypothetical protein
VVVEAVADEETEEDDFAGTWPFSSFCDRLLHEMFDPGKDAVPELGCCSIRFLKTTLLLPPQFLGLFDELFGRRYFRSWLQHAW